MGEEYLKYSGRIVEKKGREYRLIGLGDVDEKKKTYLSASSFDCFNFGDAIELLARKKFDSLDSQAKAQTALWKLEKQLLKKYEKQIAAFQETHKAMMDYEKDLKDETKLKGCISKLEGTSMYDDPSVKKILNTLKATHSKKQRELSERIRNNSKKVRGLPLVSGLVETKIIDKDKDKVNSEKAYTRFEMKEGTINIDTDQFSELCVHTIRAQEVLERNRRKESEKERTKKITEYAAKNNIGNKEAEEQLAAKERKSELGVEYSITLRDIDTISKVLNMPIPENIKARFKEGEIEQYEQARAKSTKALAEYGELIQEISDLELDISKAQRFKKELEELKSLSISDKQKEKFKKRIEKLEKRIEKLISKAKKRKAKCEDAKEKVRNGKSLSKYFDQIATYREFITDNEIRSTRRFETHREYHEALERGIISEEEPVIIGKIDEKAMKEAEERRERVESVWHAEIATSIKRSKEPMALPAPSPVQKVKEKEGFREGLRTNFDGILPEDERTGNEEEKEVNDKKAPDVEIEN